MRIFNSNFAELNSAVSTEPRFTIVIAFDTGETDLVYFTSHDDNDLPDGAVAIMGCVEKLSARTQSINPDKGSSSIGGATFNLVDIDSEITELLADRLSGGDSLRKKTCWIYKGFRGLDWEDYEIFFTFLINSYDSDSGAYSFKLSDIQREERDSIFIRDETNLRVTIDDRQLRIPVTATTTTGIFNLVKHDSSYTDRPSQEVGYILIENEIICHNGLFTHTVDGVCFRVVQRGALGTAKQGHAVDSTDEDDKKPPVSEYIFLEGPALKVLYALQTGILYGQGDKVLPENWHLGIDADWIELDDYLEQGPDVWDPATNDGKTIRFGGLDKETGKQFIEEQICSWLGAFRPVRGDGKLGFKRLDPILSDSSYVGILTTDVIMSNTPLIHDLEAVVNKILVRWNYEDLNKKYTRKNWLLDLDSIAKYQDAEPQEILLRGVHTANATDTELKEYFNVKRDRYSGAPLKMSVTVLPSATVYEVGDPVRVIDETIRDPVAGGTLDRVFEIQSVSHDLENGQATYQLFASSQRAGEIVTTAADSVLDDAAYTGAGYTNLSSVLTISGDAITANGNLTTGKYFYNGNLTLNSSRTVTFNGHVELWIKGFFQINGTLDGKGRGLAGAAADNEPNFGTPGYLGITYPSAGLRVQADLVNHSGEVRIADAVQGNAGAGSLLTNTGVFTTPVVGTYSAIPFFTLKNNSTSLKGLPTHMKGTSGSCGAMTSDIFGSPAGLPLRANGGAGGDGGASICIISRGGAFGAAGAIDTSGDDGATGGFITRKGMDFYGGTGAGGYPGGASWFVDGDHTAPTLSSHHVANVGDSAPAGLQLQGPLSTGPGTFIEIDTSEAWSCSTGANGPRTRSVPVSTSSIQYIPAIASAAEQLSPLPSDVENFIAGPINDAMNFSWSRIPDADRAGYTIKYGPVGSVWEEMNLLTEETRGTRITNAHVPPGTWNFGIKAKDYDGNESENAAYYEATMTSTYSTIASVQHNPAWTGATLTNFGVHCSGKLYPKSKSFGDLVAVISETSDTLQAYRIARPVWVAVGNPLSLVGITNPRIAALSDTDVAVIDDTNRTLRLYTFDGEDWTPLGASISIEINIAGYSIADIIAMSETDVVIVSSNDKNLRWYRFDYVAETWSLLGTHTFGGPFSGYLPRIAKLTDTDVAFFSDQDDSIRVFRFNLTTFVWSQVGSGFPLIANGHGVNRGDVGFMNATDIAFFDDSNNLLKMLRYDSGTGNWSLVGTALTPTGVFTGGSNLTVLNDSDIAMHDSASDTLRRFRFNGSIWVQLDSGFTITSGTFELDLTCLNRYALTQVEAATYVPYPFDEYSAELEEQELDFDDIVRSWIQHAVYAGPAETGAPNFTIEIDYHLAAGAYDGWEVWSPGEIAAKFAKYRLTMNIVDTDDAYCYINDALTVLDTVIENLRYPSLTIAAGGTTIVHDLPFHSIPGVSIVPEGATAKMFTIENNLTTQCTVHLFSTTGVDVGGIASITFTGNQKRL